MAILSPPVTHSGSASPTFYSTSRPSTLPRLQSNLRRNRYAPLVICFAASLPPDGPNRPPGKDPFRPTGFVSTISRFQDRLRISFAVLFWLSLFFWSSAWHGRNSGRPD